MLQYYYMKKSSKFFYCCLTFLIGIAVGEVIMAINGEKITKESVRSLNIKESLVLQVKRRFETLDVKILIAAQLHYPLFKIIPVEKPNAQQSHLYEKWINA